MSRLQIFKPGKHTDMHGRALEFTAADVEATAKAYDPAKFEAPLVVGHPDSNAPAYGWVKSLTFAETLEAEPDQVDAAFAELVNKGRFKKISASFYLPDAPNNPVPGVYYLRHVGFLGAAAPAVKGLKPASFKADEEGVVEFSDDGYLMSTVAALFRSLRDSWIARFGREDADKTIPDYQVQWIADSATREINDSVPGFTEAPALALSEGDDAMSQEKVRELEGELADARKTISDQGAALVAQKLATRRADFTKFADGLVNEGKLLPAMVAGIVAFAMALPDDQETVQFGEGDQAKKQSPYAFFRDHLAAGVKVVVYGEHEGARRAAAPAPTDSADFVAPPGAVVDSERLEVHRLALAYQKANPNTDYLTAVQAVQKGA